jgi:aryl-alcohol dehydrogenase-like predicted oxidoreductase
MDERRLGVCGLTVSALGVGTWSWSDAPVWATALDRGLARLDVETLDLYLIHWPYTVLRIEPLMDAMAAMHAGKVRAVGVSNYTAPQMRRVHARLSGRTVARDPHDGDDACYALGGKIHPVAPSLRIPREMLALSIKEISSWRR